MQTFVFECGGTAPVSAWKSEGDSMAQRSRSKRLTISPTQLRDWASSADTMSDSIKNHRACDVIDNCS